MFQAEEFDAIARSNLEVADQERERRVKQAREIETEALSTTSASVMADLLANDLGARIKWYGITALLVTIELLPLLLKSLRGRTLVGLRLMQERALRAKAIESEAELAGLQADTDTAQARVCRAGIAQAQESAQLMQYSTECAIAQMKAIALLKGPGVIAREIASRESQIQQHMHSHPSHTVVANAWADAIRQAALTLAATPAHP